MISTEERGTTFTLDRTKQARAVQVRACKILTDMLPESERAEMLAMMGYGEPVEGMIEPVERTQVSIHRRAFLTGVKI